MELELHPHEARVIGCLIEKQITTPDQYPLSLNALTNACNQKSNRDPVLALDEATVQQVVDALSRKHMVMEKSGFGSRVPKYQQRFCNTEFSNLQFTPQELAVVCELLLRGPQTPGELRSRGSRMAEFSDVVQVEQALEALAQRAGDALVMRLPREPGRRESRYAHLFSGTSALAAAVAAAPAGTTPEPAAAAPAGRSNAERIDALEEEVRALRAELDDLRRQLRSA
jgi:uncharacterized protein